MMKVLFAEVFYVYGLSESKRNLLKIRIVLISSFKFGNKFFFRFLTKFRLKSITLMLEFILNNKNKASTYNKTILNVIKNQNFLLSIMLLICFEKSVIKSKKTILLFEIIVLNMG